VDLDHERHAFHANIPLLGFADTADEAKQAASKVFDAWLARSGLTPQLDNQNRQPGFLRFAFKCKPQEALQARFPSSRLPIYQ
jgi:hypothetical protein